MHRLHCIASTHPQSMFHYRFAEQAQGSQGSPQSLILDLWTKPSANAPLSKVTVTKTPKGTMRDTTPARHSPSRSAKGLSLWQGLGEKQRPWRFERVPQPLKNGRVPIKKKLQYKARPFFKICGYQTANKSASKLQGLAKQIGICARLSSLPPWSSWICAPLLWFL